MAEALDFNDMQTIEIPVKYADKSYILREATGAASAQYRNAMMDCTKLGADGKPTIIKGLANIEALLVSLCLRDNDGKRVPIDEVNSWPSRVVKVLYEKVQVISGLKEEEEIPLEDSGSTEDG